jgi:hypothetical protein
VCECLKWKNGGDGIEVKSVKTWKNTFGGGVRERKNKIIGKKLFLVEKVVE